MVVFPGIPLTIAACLLMLPQAAEWDMIAKIVYAMVNYSVLSIIYSVEKVHMVNLFSFISIENGISTIIA